MHEVCRKIEEFNPRVCWMLLGDEQIFERGVCSRVCVWLTGVITTLANESTRCVALRHHDVRVGGSIPGLGSFNTVTVNLNNGESICWLMSINHFLLSNSANNDITLCSFQRIIVVYVAGCVYDGLEYINITNSFVYGWMVYIEFWLICFHTFSNVHSITVYASGATCDNTYSVSWIRSLSSDISSTLVNPPMSTVPWNRHFTQ